MSYGPCLPSLSPSEHLQHSDCLEYLWTTPPGHVDRFFALSVSPSRVNAILPRLRLCTRGYTPASLVAGARPFLSALAPPYASPAWLASLTLFRRVPARNRFFFLRPCLTSFGSWRRTPRDSKPSHMENPITASRTVIQRSALRNRRSSHPHAHLDDENKNHDVSACTLLRKNTLSVGQSRAGSQCQNAERERERASAVSEPEPKSQSLKPKCQE